MAQARIDCEISVSDREDSQDIAVIVENLRHHIDENFGPANKRPFVAIAKANDGSQVGGLKGFSHWSWLYIQQLWVAESFRSAGLGRDLLKSAEIEAAHRGNIGLYVDTFDVRARDFYVRNGYQEFGNIPDFPPNFSRFFLMKRIQAGPISGSDK